MHPIQAVTGSHQLRKPKQTQKLLLLRETLRREGGREREGRKGEMGKKSWDFGVLVM